MRHTKAIAISSTAAILLAISASSADARWYRRHYGPGPVAGFVGGVVVGAATIATLPFAVLGAAARPAPPPPPPPAYYGPGPGPYGYGSPPPGYYRQYGPPPGYYGGY